MIKCTLIYGRTGVIMNVLVLIRTCRVNAKHTLITYKNIQFLLIPTTYTYVKCTIILIIDIIIISQ